MVQAFAHAAISLRQVLAITARDIGNRPDPVSLQRLAHSGANAPDNPDLLLLQKIKRLNLTDHRHTSRLIQVRRDLGQKLVVRKSDGTGNPQFLLHLLYQPRHLHHGWGTIQAFGSGQIQKRFVQR